MNYCIGGIDPGKSGGFVTLDEVTGKIIDVLHVPRSDQPTKKGSKAFKPDFELMSETWGRALKGCRWVYIENVWGAAPQGRRQGGTGMFNFGFITGLIRGMVLTLSIPYTLVLPQKWKAAYGLLNQEKEASIKLARDTWPLQAASFKRKTVDEGVAEAALIADWGRQYGDH